MCKNKRRNSTLISFGNYKWTHWLVVVSFMVLGLIVAILPCAKTKRVLVVPIIIGKISISIAIFCIVDYVLFVKNRRNIRRDKSEVDKDNIKEGKK